VTRSAPDRVLVLGGGAREHALADRLAADPAVRQLFAAPGNPGIAELAECHPVPPEDPAAVLALARQLGVDLVVVGPEAPLMAGVADVLNENGIPCFGPTAAAARIEGSKAYAKEVMAAAGVPTAGAAVFDTAGLARAVERLAATAPPYVVKYDGLAAGKGVTVTTDLEAAVAAVRDRLREPQDRILLEDYLAGPEFSLFALTDGRTVRPLPAACDYKRVGDGDQGPNTGGMGSYAPAAWLQPSASDVAVERIVTPTVHELARRGTPFRGLLFAGLALGPEGPAVVEFNARFGDPETESLLLLLRTPLAGLLFAAATGDLAALPPPEWGPGAAVTVVVAAAGYPAAPRLGDPVAGLADAGSVPGVRIFHGGTAVRGGRLVTSSGRVLAVSGYADDVATARERVYRAVGHLEIPGGHYRRDIAQPQQMSGNP
jgi:phosphoribosylamine--glycine ligase